jgi:hypothetical protein
MAFEEAIAMAMENTARKDVAHGGRLVKPNDADAPEITARFADPDGNALGLRQEQDAATHTAVAGGTRVARGMTNGTGNLCGCDRLGAGTS